MNQSNIKNLVVLSISSVVLAVVVLLTDFTKLKTNPIPTIIIFITASYIFYFIIFYGTKYYRIIWSKTYEKGKKKIEGILALDFNLKNFFKFVMLSIIIDFLALALLIDTPLKTDLSIIPLGDILTPIIGQISESNAVLQSPLGILSYISSPWIFVLAGIGPVAVILLKQIHIRYGEDPNDYPGSRILMIFLIVSPLVLFLSGRIVEKSILFLFYIDLYFSLIMAVATSFFYIFFMMFFYFLLFSKIK